MHGLGIGGWLTNYKRFGLLPEDRVNDITQGDEEHFDTYITRNDVKNIASFGADHIRLAFDQMVLEEYDKPFSYRERGFSHLQDFVSWCADEHVNVILNLHKALGCVCDFKDGRSLLDDPLLQERFIGLWLEIERRFSGSAAVFELMNEVPSAEDAKWNALAAKTIAAIRGKNPGRVIMIGGSSYNSVDRLKYMDVPDDDKVVYTFHFYNPFEFTHQRGILQKMQHWYNREMPYPCDIERYREAASALYGKKNAYSQWKTMDSGIIRSMLQPAADFLESHPGKTLTCGEFGVIRHCPVQYKLAWFKDVTDFLRDYNISICAWNYLSTPYDGNRFSLVDDETRRPIHPEIFKTIFGA